jgi:hypothetical protein
MNSPEEIFEIADTRLMEAKVLLEKGLFSGAFYLAGYSVELYLKAKICQNFGVPNLFDKRVEIGNINEVRKALLTHNLSVLLTFSGLRTEYDLLDENKPDILLNISFLMNR